MYATVEGHSVRMTLRDTVGGVTLGADKSNYDESTVGSKRSTKGAKNLEEYKADKRIVRSV